LIYDDLVVWRQARVGLVELAEGCHGEREACGYGVCETVSGQLDYVS
jgi:hypothetical protein